MKALFLSLLLAASASAQLLSDVKDYPIFELSVRIMLPATATAPQSNKTIEVSWNRLDSKPTLLTVSTLKTSFSPQSRGAGVFPGARTEKNIDYIRVFNALKAFTDSYQLSPSTNLTHEAYNKLIKTSPTLGTANVDFGWQVSGCKFQVFQGYQDSSFRAAAALFAALEQELSDEQLKILADQESPFRPPTKK
jgi:hypothetical protein